MKGCGNTGQRGAECRRRELAAVVLLLLLAAALRLVALEGVPPGPSYDELQNARLSERVLAGRWAIYFPENFGQESLYPTLAALSVRALGRSLFALRLPGALLGVLAVLVLYLVGRRLAGRRAAFLAAAFQAVSFWPLIETRVVLETSLLPPLAGLSVLFIARGLDGRARSPRRSLLELGLAGVFLGAHVYAYTPGRVMPALPLVLVAYLLLFGRRVLRRRWAGLLLLCLVTVAVVAPLVLFLRAHPESEQRVDQLSRPLEALRAGDPRPVLKIAAGTLGMFSVRGEPQWLYNVADRPLFDPLTSLLFYVGLMLCGAGLRDWRRGLILVWLLVGLGPAFVSLPAASFTHTLAAQPAVYLLLGLGAAAAWEWLGRWRAWAGRAAALLLLALNLGLSCRAYFAVWARAPQVRELYQGGVAAIARELDAGDPPGPVAVGGPYVNYWHPWNAEGLNLVLRRDDLSVRWFNPAGGWVWPSGPGLLTFYFPGDPLGQQEFDPALEALFAADAVPLSASTGDLAFRVDRPFALEERLASLPPTRLAWPPDLAHLPPPGLPLAFAERLALLGIEADQAAVAPGDQVRLVTYWEVRGADPSPVVAFVHLTSDGQDIWGQQDWLDVRMDGLQPGDRFAQVHVLPVSGDTPPGTYHVQLGLYRPDTLVRLPAVAGDAATASRVWVAEVIVR
jgi:4-amino-4-deoxy-L-arabinose transferase-like glycosyltransferase